MEDQEIERIERPFDRFRSYDQLLSEEGLKGCGKEVVSIFQRESQLIAAATSWPHALVSTGLSGKVFEVADYRYAFGCIRKLVEGGVLAPGSELPKDTFVAELRRTYTTKDGYFDDARAEMWIDRLLHDGRPLLEYALRVLVPEQIARFNLRQWMPISEGLIVQTKTDWRVREVHQAWRKFAMDVEAQPDGGQLGTSLSQLVKAWDPRDKENRKLIPLGFPAIDEPNGGGHGRGEMMVIGGGTNVGKSYVCERLLMNLAERKYRVLHISVEDESELMVARAIADFGKVSPVKLRARAAVPEEVDKAKERAVERLGDYVYYLDAPKWPVSKICDAIRRHVFLLGVDVAIVDYIQAIDADEPTNNRTNDMAIIVSRLKRCAKENEVALIVTSQYSRESYKDGAEPNINACKFAGEIENETEIMLLTWKPEDGILRGKIAKLKWSRTGALKYTIPVDDESGCIANVWPPDFSSSDGDRRAQRDHRTNGAASNGAGYRGGNGYRGGSNGGGNGRGGNGAG